MSLIHRIAGPGRMAAVWAIRGQVTYPEKEVPAMDLRSEIAERVEKLSPDLQKEVLRFISSLGTTRPEGEKGAAFRPFAGSLDDTSAREMIQAIEEECERVDAGEW